MASTKCPWVGVVGLKAWWNVRAASLWQHPIGLTESDIHHIVAQAKIASISEYFSGECFDFDCLMFLVVEDCF